MNRKQHLRNWLTLVLVSVCVSANTKTSNIPAPAAKAPGALFSQKTDGPQLKHLTDSVFDVIGLESYGLSREAFFSACKGYQYLLHTGALTKKNLISICDYSQSANSKRLYVIDLFSNKVLFNTYVSHGKKSGDEFATSFSNINNSHKSSLGFLVTEDAYNGFAGYSLRFNGMEPGINDQVKKRFIVFHGSWFVNENVMRKKGTIGKSLGCPAVPYGQQRAIIDVIKGGSCFYIYSPDPSYAQASRILNADFDYASFIATVNKPSESGGGNFNDAMNSPIAN